VLSRTPLDDRLLAAFALPRRFATRDGATLFLFVQPDDPESAATTIAPFVEAVRARVAALRLDSAGVRAGYTGLPQYALDDRDVVTRDISRLSGLSFLAVLALFAVSFRSLREPALAMLVLAWAALVTAGLGAFVPGHLTLVSAFFFSILFGLGIDFGVHLVGRAEELEAAGASRRAAFERAVVDLAPGLGTGAATTALSFFVFLLSGFRGFAELGGLAGAGVVVALFAMVTLLPVLLVTLPGAGRAVRDAAGRRIGRALFGLQRPFLAALLGVVALAALASLLVAGGPRFDGDYLALQPRGSEAVRLERRMIEGSDFAPQFAAFVVPDAERAAALAARLRAEPTVATVRALPDFDRALAIGATRAAEWELFRAGFVARDGRQAVYAFPKGDVWNEATRSDFLAAMRAIAPDVTGMPVLADLFLERSRHALAVAGGLAALLLVLFVAVDLRRPLASALALAPTVAAVATTLAVQRFAGLDFNPLNLLALPVIVGVSEDAGVHLVHRFVAEGGDLARALAGTGRSLLISGTTTLAGFGALVFADHRGLASLAALLTLGVGLSLLFTLFALPGALVAARSRLLSASPSRFRPAPAPEPTA
jgi:predicted RND superfamily exporter protein